MTPLRYVAPALTWLLFSGASHAQSNEAEETLEDARSDGGWTVDEGQEKDAPAPSPEKPPEAEPEQVPEASAPEKPSEPTPSTTPVEPAETQQPKPAESAEDAPQAAEDPAELHPRHRPIAWHPTDSQLGVIVGVPFYDESIINAEITVDIRYGRKIGWFLPYFSAGFRQARLDPKRVPNEARRKKLEAWHMTIGLRVEVPASRHFIPFVGIAGELAHWGFEASTAEFCHEPWYPNAWQCYERYEWKAGHALKGQLGFAYKPYPDFALEFSVERGQIIAPEMFTRPVTFTAPAVGVVWHH